MRSRTFTLPSFALLTLLFLAGCASTGGQGEVVLENTMWRIVEVDGVQARRADSRDLTPHLYIDSADGRVHGAGGCNRFSGAYRATATELSFGSMVTTRALCSEIERQRVEDTLIRALEEADRYLIDGVRLWIYSGSTVRVQAVLW